MFHRPLLACIAVALLAGCVALPRPLGTEAVTPAYAAGGGRYDDGSSLIFLVRVLEQAGNTAFCGVRTDHATARMSIYHHMVAGAAAIEIAGDRIVSGLQMLPEAPWRQDMTGATARCFLTGHSWHPAYAGAIPRVRAARLRFLEGDGGFGIGGSGESVTFRPAPVERPLP